MKKLILFAPILTIFLVSFTPKSVKTVHIAVAANMQFVMEQMKTEFEKQTGIIIEMSVGSSGKLATQIMEKAPFDVFVSADMNNPNELFKKGFATTHPEVYATGTLVLWTVRPELTPAKDLNVLLMDVVKKIAIANPKTAPYGDAAQQVLEHHKIFGKVKDKLVFGENIGQAFQFVVTQAADIGFVAKSEVLSDEMKGKGKWIDIDKNDYKPIAQGAVLLTHGTEQNKENSMLFYKFLYSKEAKAIYKKYGYIVNE